MRGKVCIVTGASAGLGKATALGLAKLGATVVMLCRDRSRGERAISEVRTESGSETVELAVADLSSMAAVRGFVDGFRASYPRLDVLVNNAAVYKRSREVTREGLETTFAVNHLAHFLLTTALLDLLRHSTPARVINVAAPSLTKLDFEDLQGARRYSAFHAFGASKTCNLLFTFDLARRLEGTGVTVNAVHPGLVRSNLLAEGPAVFRALTRAFSSPADRGAEGPVWLASSAEVERTSGRFFKGRREIAASAYARDPVAQRKLWEASVALVGPPAGS